MGQRGSFKGNKKCVELNENNNVVYGDTWGSAGSFKKKYAALDAYISKDSLKSIT